MYNRDWMYFILYESTRFHSDIYFMSCKIVPSALPHFENKIIVNEVFFFLKKMIKGKKPRKLKTISPNLLTKTGIFFSLPSYLESRSAWTWRTKQKRSQRVFPLFSWHPQTIANKQTQFLYQGIAHGSINIHHLVSRTILPIKTKTTKPNVWFLFFLILNYIIISVYVSVVVCCHGFSFTLFMWVKRLALQL